MVNEASVINTLDSEINEVIVPVQTPSEVDESVDGVPICKTSDILVDEVAVPIQAHQKVDYDVNSKDLCGQINNAVPDIKYQDFVIYKKVVSVKKIESKDTHCNSKNKVSVRRSRRIKKIKIQKEKRGVKDLQEPNYFEVGVADKIMIFENKVKQRGVKRMFSSRSSPCKKHKTNDTYN